MRSLFFLPFTLIVVACGGGKDTVSFKDSEGNSRSIEVTQDGDKRIVKSTDGIISAEGTQGGKNARFPDYAPQYPGATIQSVVDMDAGGAIKMHVITQMTKDTPDAVMAFYKEKVAASGKSIKEVKSATGPMLMIGASSPLDMDGTVTAMAAPSGGTSVNVSVQERISK